MCLSSCWRAMGMWGLGMGLWVVWFIVGEGFDPDTACPGASWGGEVVAGMPRLVSQERNGDRFEVGKPDDALTLLHVYGSPYELGWARGALLRSEIQSMYTRIFRYLEDEVISSLHLSRLPDSIARGIARLAVNGVLDATYLATLRFTPARFVDEMLGLSQGAEVDYQDVARIQMLPELIQASCSLLGSWGPATIRTNSCGQLYQMRALDWDMNLPLLEYHTLVIYHPADGNAFALFTWSGFIGCVTGYSGRVGISEKLWQGYNGSSSRIGMPWPFVLRDVLQFTDNIQQAWSLMSSTQRTCPLLVGIGSAEDSRLVLLGYTSNTVELYDNSNYTQVTSFIPTDSAPGVIFVDKYVQPSDDECMSSMVKEHYGELGSKALINMVSWQKTGEIHTAVYDFTANVVYFSWATISPLTGDIIPAYRRYFLELNMSSLLETPPNTCGMLGCETFPMTLFN